MLLPVALDVQNRPVLIIGGGGVAARKATAFIEAGALVTVVSPELVDSFPTSITHLARRYETSDLIGYSLVLACTNLREVNAQIAADAKTQAIWCNVADAPDNSDFHTTSVIRRGEIAVGVSTGGISPVLARFVRQKIESALPPELEILLEIAGSYHIPTEIRGDLWRQILESNMLPLLIDGQRDAATLLFEKLLQDVSRPLEAS